MPIQRDFDFDYLGDVAAEIRDENVEAITSLSTPDERIYVCLAANRCDLLDMEVTDAINHLGPEKMGVLLGRW